RLVVQLAEAFDLLPSSLFVHGIDCTKPSQLGGSFGDIFEASQQGQAVALKQLQFFQTGLKKPKCCREALIWKNLDHDYVMPFIGVKS
ncbi:hypothetical protein B0H16DRAFT_1242379, partial [Mycena metata]